MKMALVVYTRKYTRFLAVLSVLVLDLFVYVLFVQGYFLPYCKQKFESGEVNGVKSTKKDKNIDGVHIQNSDLIQIFIDEIEKQDVTVFLIEPRILKIISHLPNAKAIERYNIEINNDIHRVSFGVTANTVPDFQNVKFHNLQEKDFEIFKVKGSTSIAEFNRNIFHIFLYHQLRRLLLHLVVFYNRGDNFIWNDRIHLVKPPNWLKIEQLSFGHNASGFNKLELTQIQLGDLTLLTPSNISRFLHQDLPESTFIECNRTRVTEFFTANPKFKNNKNLDMRVSKLLKSLKSTMDEVGVKYWLSSGTLLGWYRQCGMITYTNDMDFEVYVKDYTPEILKSFKSRGFRQTRQLGRLNDSLEMTFVKENVEMDVFYVYEEPYHTWYGGVGGNGQKYRFIYPINTLCWGELLGVAVRVPCDPAKYLVASYGTNWMRPDERYLWSESPRNIKKVGQWTREEMKETVQYMR